jgi:hypothetical protein
MVTGVLGLFLGRAGPYHPQAFGIKIHWPLLGAQHRHQAKSATTTKRCER